MFSGGFSEGGGGNGNGNGNVYEDNHADKIPDVGKANRKPNHHIGEN